MSKRKQRKGKGARGNTHPRRPWRKKKKYPPEEPTDETQQPTEEETRPVPPPPKEAAKADPVPEPLDPPIEVHAQDTQQDTRQPPTTELTDEVQQPTETEATQALPPPKEPVDTRPSKGLASLRWAEGIVRSLRRDPDRLLRTLEAYVAYSYDRISPEAIDFFLTEISWRSGRTRQQEAERIHPFAQRTRKAPITKSA